MILRRQISDSILRSIYPGLICILSFALFTIGLLPLAGEGIAWTSAMGIVGLGFILWMSGDAVRLLFNIDEPSVRVPLTFVLGATIVSLVSTSALILRTQALVVFAGYSVVILLVYVGLHAFGAGRRTPKGVRITDTMVPSVLFMFVAFWTFDLSRALPVLEATFHLNAWIDYYIHATEISQMGSAFSSGRGAVLLAGAPIPLYHYAYLGVSSVLAGFIEIPPLGLATAFLAPFGIFILVCGAYVCGAVRGSRTIGIVSALAVLFLPDASTYAFRNGFWGFHWLLMTAPGTGYACGIALSGYALFHISRSQGDSRLAWLAAALLIGTLFFRIQIFLLCFPAIIAALAYENPRFRRHRRTAGWVLLGSVCGLLALWAVPWMPGKYLASLHVGDFASLAHLSQDPTAYSGIARWVVAHVPPYWAAVLGVLFVPIVVLGLLIVIHPTVATLLSRMTGSGFSYLSGLPAFLVLTFLAMIVFMPSAPSGDYTEFKHRSFPMVYAVFLIWSLADSGSIVREFLATKGSLVRISSTVLLVGVLALGIASQRTPWVPEFEWGKRLYGAPVEPELVSAAFYVRLNRNPSDVVAILPTEPESSLADRGTIFASLADTPVYLARYPMQILGSQQRRSVAELRMKVLNSIDLDRHGCDSFRTLQRENVMWLVTSGIPKARTVTEAFSLNDVAVYDVESAVASSCRM